MPSLTEELGQAKLAREVVESVRAPGSRVLLAGPSGSGKSTVLRLAAGVLGELGFVISLKGEASPSGTRFLCLNRTLANTRPRRQFRGNLAAGLTAPLKVVPYVGSAAADLAKIAAAAFTPKLPEFLSGEQQDLLNGLQNLSRERTSGTIVIDDVQWLDNETAGLVLCLAIPEVANAYPFARGLRIISVETTDGTATLDTALLDKFRKAKVLKCPFPDKRAFRHALVEFGMRPEPAPKLLDDLYAISRGHLGIAGQVARMNQGIDLPSLLADGDPDRLMAELLSLRLDGLRGAEPLRRLLSIAACSGSAFPEAEVRCAFMDPEAFTTALEAAYREELLLTDGETLAFAHDSIRAAAERLASPDAPDLHGRLAACVKRLRPGDYPARLRHVRLSNDAEGRSELAFAVAMEEVRGKRMHASSDPSELGPLADLLAGAREAYRLMDGGDHREALALMQPYYTGESGLAQGEVVVLLAMNHLKFRTAEGYARAASLLEFWRDRRGEPELWQRLMSILLMAWASSGEIERATQLYTALGSELELAGRTDPTLKNRAAALNRKADIFLPSELSAKHIRWAAEWFGPPEPGGMPRNAFEHIACRVNLSGALFTIGQFAEAASVAEEAVRYSGLLRAGGLRVPEGYKALNNYAVATYRSGLAPAAELATALAAGAGGDLRRDRVLVSVNLACLLLLGGQPKEGTVLLEEAWNRSSAEELDGYYLLYAGSNLAVARGLAGDSEGGLGLLMLADGYLDSVPRWNRQAHRRRLNFLRQALGGAGVSTPEELDAYPGSRRAPDGDQDPWRSIGHGFILSDIQVWSEG